MHNNKNSTKMKVTTLHVTLVHSMVTNRVFSYLCTCVLMKYNFLIKKTWGVNSCTFRKTLILAKYLSVLRKIIFKILSRSKINISVSGCKSLHTCQNGVQFCLPIVSKLRNVTDVNCAGYSIYSFVITLLTLHTTESG